MFCLGYEILLYNIYRRISSKFHMERIKNSRVESIDVLRGLVMVIMALDHTRDYFHLGATLSDPANLETTTPILFFTRFITHFCAPVFVFLAGTSASLYGSKKPTTELFKFLFSRGIWLIFLELVLTDFLWWFDITYSFIYLNVIWAIGFSMICLSFLVYLPKKVLLAIGIILVAGHNLLDNIIMEGNSIKSVLWYLLHQKNNIPLGESRILSIGYPVLPWIGVMVLGYCFGTFYEKGFDVSLRKKWLIRLGVVVTLLFFILRGINIYGDLVPWSNQKDITYTILSFLNVTKYPPSLTFLLITLGPSFLFLYATDKLRNKLTDFFIVFGRVPLFYYFLHILIIHLTAIMVHTINGGNWKDLISNNVIHESGHLATYGYSLWVVYLVWICIVLLLYPLCKWYMKYKNNNKHKWWLHYL
jgi:uncharacterized membrane protein